MTITAKDIVDAQAHIGTLKSEAHPKTSKYWSEVVNGVVIVNPEIVAQQIETAREKIKEAKKQGKEVLIISEKKMIAEELAQLGDEAWVAYLNYKFPSWFITNFETFKKRIESMNTMERFVESDNYHALTKKEQLVYARKLARVLKIYKGVKKLTKKPDLIVVVDGQMMDSLIDEITKTNIDNIIIAGTNFARRWDEQKIIVTNIVSHKGLHFVLNTLIK